MTKCETQHTTVIQSEDTHLPAVFVSHIKLFQENFGHVFLPIMNLYFVAFEISSEGSLTEAFILTVKMQTDTTLKCSPT